MESSNKETSGKKIERAVTINKPAGEVYRFWRNFENLPTFMKHLEKVKITGETTSHWVAKAPAGTKAEWDAEIYEEKENEFISWRSLAHSDVESSGTVRFKKAPGNRGTEVQVSLNYKPPLGALGVVIAKLTGEEPGQQVQADLRCFKQIMEAGEVPQTEGQPSGRDKKKGEKA